MLIGIVESALELVPKLITNHPTILAAAQSREKKPEHTLLDEALHARAMHRLDAREKRGRPDILHRSLLMIFDSVFAREKPVHVFIHTYDGRIIEITPQTRLPRRFNRFTGLIEQLLITGQVPPQGPPLLQVRQDALATYVKGLEPSQVFLLSSKGALTSPARFIQQLLAESNPLILMGGFAHGTFSSEITQLANTTVSLDPESLPTSTILGMILHNLETVLQLGDQRIQRALEKAESK